MPMAVAKWPPAPARRLPGPRAGSSVRTTVRRSAALLFLAFTAGTAFAGEAVVVGATAMPAGGTWNFDVTVQHADDGWEHYVDSWRVSGPDGTVYGERQLFHPHVDEQPFTRSLAGVAIPPGVTRVTIEAHDPAHGWGRPFTLDLPR
jgi:hypothetical protein